MEFPYLTVKYLHVASVALSISLFALRAGWRLCAPGHQPRRWEKFVPHVIDTALLLSGVLLAWQLGAAGVRGWLPAKLVALLLYIVLGAVALRHGRTRGVRTAAAIGAVGAFAYIVSVAITKSPAGAFGG